MKMTWLHLASIIFALLRPSSSSALIFPAHRFSYNVQKEFSKLSAVTTFNHKGEAWTVGGVGNLKHLPKAQKQTKHHRRFVCNFSSLSLSLRVWLGYGNWPSPLLSCSYIFVSFALAMDNSFPITPDPPGLRWLRTRRGGMSSGSTHALVAY